MTKEPESSQSVGSNAVGGSTIVSNSRVCIGQRAEMRLKDDNFNTWVERFELPIC